MTQFVRLLPLATDRSVWERVKKRKIFLFNCQLWISWKKGTRWNYFKAASVHPENLKKFSFHFNWIIKLRVISSHPSVDCLHKKFFIHIKLDANIDKRVEILRISKTFFIYISPQLDPVAWFNYFNLQSCGRCDDDLRKYLRVVFFVLSHLLVGRDWITWSNVSHGISKRTTQVREGWNFVRTS